MISCVFEKIYDFGKNCGNFYRVLPISRAYFFRGDYLFSRLTNFEGASQLRGPVVYVFMLFFVVGRKRNQGMCGNA